MIIAKNIHKYYGDVEVLKGVDFHIKKGEIVAIVGPSGAGKTTLLQIIGTLDKPLEEKDFNLSLNGISLKNISDKDVSTFRNNEIGFIFQFHELLPEFSAIENICIPGMIRGDKTKELQFKAEELLKSLNLIRIKNQKPSELSGGEQQRACIARALIREPDLLLLDEPFSNLDNISKAEFKSILKNVIKTLNIGLLFVTHDSKDALTFSDEIMVIQNGKLLKKDTPLKLTTAPPSVYAAKLLGLTNIFEGSLIRSITEKFIQDWVSLCGWQQNKCRPSSNWRIS